MKNPPLTRAESSRPPEAGRNPVDVLADEFMLRLQRDEQPSIEEYTDNYPEHADEIRTLFPVLQMLDHAGVHEDLDGPPSDNDIAAGIPERLGEYRVIGEIGRGGMGVVYEAEHATLRRRVALKVLPPDAALNSRYVERFRREVRSAGRLHHTNIVPLFEVGTQNGVHFYAMQFIHGQGLDKIIDELRRIDRGSSLGKSAGTERRFEKSDGDESRLVATERSIADGLVSGSFQPCDVDPPRDENAITAIGQLGITTPDAWDVSSGETSSDRRTHYFQQIARVGMQVADALACAHEHSILHRDIKPSNLLLDTRGNIWVTDFGLAKGDEDDLTRSGDFVGTLRYMAPERIRGATEDVRGDIYSLGVTLYEVATLQPAFADSDRAKLIQRIAVDEPTSPRKRNPRIPRDLETIILKAIEKDPARRYRTATAMADDLRLFLEDRPVRARRITVVERVWRWCRRNPFQALFPAMLGLLIAITTIGSLLFAISQRRHALELTKAELSSRQRLFDSHVDQANAIRLSGRKGQRDLSMQAIKSAAELLPTLGYTDSKTDVVRSELRNQVFASLALSDLRGPLNDPLALPRGWHARGIDPSYQRIALNDDQGNISIRRVDDGAEIAWLPGPGFPAWVIKFSHDGRYVAAKYHEPNRNGRADFWIWDVQSGETVIRWMVPMNDAGFVFHPTRPHCLFHNRNRKLVRYDCRSEQFLAWIDIEAGSEHLALDPSGTQIAIAQSDRVSLFDLSGSPIVELRAFDQAFHRDDLDRTSDVLTSVTWSGDGRSIAAGSQRGIIHLWELADIASSSDSDRQSPDQLSNGRWVGHQDRIANLCLDHSGTRLVSTSWDRSVRVWNPQSQLQLIRLDDFRLPSASFGPGNQIWLADADNRLATWNLTDDFFTSVIPVGNAREYWPGAAGVIAVATNHAVEFWDTVANALIAKIDTGRTMDLGFCNDGATMITCDQQQGVRRWPIKNKSNRPVVGAAEQISALPAHRLSVDRSGKTVALRLVKSRIVVMEGTELAQHDGDRQPGISSAEFGGFESAWPQRIVEFDHPLASDVTVSPGGQFLVSTTWIGKGVRLWDLASGAMITDLAPSVGHSKCEFSPDGRWLAVSTNQGEHRLWEVGQWDAPRHIRHLGDQWGGFVAFSNDSKTLAYTASPRAIHLLDLESDQQLGAIEATIPIKVSAIDFAADGNQLSVGFGSRAHIWDLGRVRQQLKALQLDW